MMKLMTARLMLFPFELPHIQMYLEGRDFFQRFFPFRIPDSWPWKEMDEIVPWLKDQLLRNPSFSCWFTWLIAHLQDRLLIGDIGFGGPPDPGGTLELGYSIVPEYRNLGYGSEAASALIYWAFSQPQVSAVNADTWPSSLASIHLLQGLGMKRISETKDLMHWRLERSDYVRRPAARRVSYTPFSAHQPSHLPERQP